MNYNKIMLAGNLTRDVEVRYTQSNTAIAGFGIAVNRKFKGGDGHQQQEVTFVDCEAWGRTAEVIQQYFHKGSPIFIEGRLKLDQWQDKDGGNRSKLKVVVESFQFVGGGAGDGGGQQQQSRPKRSASDRRGPPRQPPPKQQQQNAEYEPIDEEDIPF